MMPVTVRRIEFSDFEALQHCVQDGRSEIVQLGRGRMSGTLTQVALGSNFRMSTGSFSTGMRSRGVASQDCWTFGMVLESSGPASALLHKVTVGDLAIIAPGHDRYTSLQGKTGYFATFIAPEELDAFLATQPGGLDSPVWRQPATVRTADPATAAANIRHLSVLSATLSEYGPRLSDRTADFFKRNILELLTAPVRDASRYQDRPPRSAVKLVSEVDRYLIDAGNRPIHISELCAKFSVHRRMLHRAFNDVLRRSPSCAASDSATCTPRC
jgi:hypothetical protein